ncbi:hypothetical protein G6F65_021079 [Rhizopus arrhizus]|nr:hypothetical protein G6F65_021079 [Rhizopus arrhizus]
MARPARGPWDVSPTPAPAPRAAAGPRTARAACARPIHPALPGPWLHAPAARSRRPARAASAGLLEHDADLALIRRQRRDGRVVDEDLALVGVGEARDQVQQGGLAAARRAQQRQEFPALDLQGHLRTALELSEE